jgi:hypothetical protein
MDIPKLDIGRTLSYRVPASMRGQAQWRSNISCGANRFQGGEIHQTRRKGGCWNDISLVRKEMSFGYGAISHELAATLEYETIRKSRQEPAAERRK